MNELSNMKPIKPPPELIAALREAEGQLTAVGKVMEGLKEMGWDTRDLDATFATIMKARDALLKAFG